MNRPPQHELFSSDRPVRSDYSREVNYARRRMITVGVITLLVVGIVYAIFGGSPSNPGDIPTIKAEGAYKQKPDDPGGIDIPHQDVRVYDQLDAKTPGVPKVEHLLPPPEAPKETPQVAVSTTVSQAAPKVDAEAPTPDAAPSSKVVTTTATPSKAEALPNAAPPTTVDAAPVPSPAPSPEPAPAPVVVTQKAETAKPSPIEKKAAAKPKAEPKAESLTIDKILQNVSTQNKSKEKAEKLVAEKPSVAAVSGEKSAIQLASVPNEAEAKSVMAKLQQKYASELGGAKLHLTKANLGSKGIYYRIQSDLIAKSEANRICSSLKKVNAGCILVGK